MVANMKSLIKRTATLVCGCRNYRTSSSVSGIKQYLKDSFNDAESLREKEFQNWAEFENRGFKKPEYMSSWFIEKYGVPNDVLKKDVINVNYKKYKHLDARHTYYQQAVRNPNEILVKVQACSLNPIDIKMCQGYGQNLMNFRRNMVMGPISNITNVGKMSEFPLVLGRDFSGTVVDIGSGVTDIMVGDEVFGSQEIHRTGTLADYVSVHLKSLSQKPNTLSHVEAAALPYVALTTLSALKEFSKSARGKQALLLGGSGGVGTFAIQYLKVKGAYVAVTCNKSAKKLCSSLGADECFDYNAEDFEKSLMNKPRFDMVFDIVGAQSPSWAKHVLKSNGSYVTLVSPIIENTDNMGVFMGLSASAGMYLKSAIFSQGIKLMWPTFALDRNGLLEVAKMIDDGSIKPVLHKVFDFDSVPQAFDLVATGKCKGKVAINVSGLPEASSKPNVEKVIHL